MSLSIVKTAFFVSLAFAPFFACLDEGERAPPGASPSRALASDADGGTIRGVVVDKTTRLPVKGAVISTVPATLDVITDDEGRFRLASALAPDVQYTLITTAQGYGDVQVPVEATPGETLVFPVSLDREDEVVGEAVSLTSTN